MATRFRLPSTGTPAVSPAFQSYTHESGVRRELIPASVGDSSALDNQAYTPDTSDHLVAGDAAVVQFVSPPMEAGIVFGAFTPTVRYAVQCFEAHANNNLFDQLYVRIVSEDGTTQRHVFRTKVSHFLELATSLTSRYRSYVTTAGSGYTTVAGDRLVVEFSVQGTPANTGGTQGHNSTFRWGSDGAGGDLAENDTQTGTTLNPWIEFSTDITFEAAGAVELAVGDSAHGHAADSPGLTQANTLAVADSVHGHAAGNAALEVGGLTLTATDSAHTHAADAPALAQANTLAANDATHAHAVESPALTQASTLAASDALHGHSAESPLLTQGHVLAAADATHAHAAEAPTLNVGGALGVADSSHAHTADAPSLVQAHILAVADALHAHTAESPTLSIAFLLAVADAAHAHAAESPTLAFGVLLAVADALHAHAADGVALTQANVLAVADALHAHMADSVAIVDDGMLPSFIGTPGARSLVATPPARSLTATPGARSLVGTPPRRQ